MSKAQSNPQTLVAPKAGDWQIELNNAPLMWGGDDIRIVFFNLNGRNFENPEPWRLQTHPEYLEYMNTVWPGAFLSGQTIKLIDPVGSVAGEHTFGGAEDRSVSAKFEGDADTLMQEASAVADAWMPSYSLWRHGGWYVHNIRHPNGSCGCVSNNYADGQWRIVCDSRRKEIGEEGDFTYPTRDAAARAERDLIGG